MRILFLMSLVFLYVDKPIASLQFDIGTSGTVTLDASINKQIASAPVGDKTRIIIYGLNQETFVGKFADVNADVSTITNVVAASPDGTKVDVVVTTLSQPQNLIVEINKDR